ncbi:ABC transporter substrate-binding protein [Streptomyces sp. NPDC056503]|uniref:ABC transporter substrate-binding protein n=1 Tax=Streptomyces sp. NPDC056503 TaxID=3345842 RepID=UPI0036C171D1
MNRRHILRAAAVTASTALVLTGCSTKGGDSAGSSDKSGIKTGPGITDSAIKVGALTDISGPFAPLGKSALQAEQLHLKQVNAAGGVCGRQIELLVRDHGFDVQKAVAAYAEVEPQIAAFGQLSGSAQTAALLDSIEKDKLQTIQIGASGTVLGHPHLRLMASTYDIDMANGVGFLVQAAKLEKGDKVGHVYIEGEYGGNAAEGARFAARKAGITLVAQTVKPTDKDLTAQVTALRAAGVKAVVFSGVPAQTASLVGVAAATGLKVPVLASAPAYVPQLLATPAKPALEKMLYVASPWPALSGDDPATKKLAEDYTKAYPKDPVNQAAQAGNAAASLLVGTLKAACEAKDLSRDGIGKALRSLTAYAEGFHEPQDFSDPSKASSTKTYIVQPAAGLPGGLKEVRGPIEHPALAEYLATPRD